MSVSTSLSRPNSWSVVRSISRSWSVDHRSIVIARAPALPVPRLAAKALNVSMGFASAASTLPESNPRTAARRTTRCRRMATPFGRELYSAFRRRDPDQPRAMVRKHGIDEPEIGQDAGVAIDPLDARIARSQPMKDLFTRLWDD